MNSSTVRSLIRDAYYQVVDNLGFRILAVLFLLPVIAFLILGFKDDGIWFLHNWRWDYPSWMLGGGGLSEAAPSAADLHQLRTNLLEGLVSLMIDQVADRFGFVFGIAAISFFVPQMLERGSADVVFSKPVSRLALFLSRYIAGLMFVGFLSVVLVGGIFLGLWLSSDYVDTGLLWSIATLVYGFAIFHAISCTLGVVTRSTIGAILLTTVFMPVNFGMHWWFEKNSMDEVAQAERVSESAKPIQRDLLDTTLRAVVDAYHIAMPKSSDAQRLARSLRRTFEAEPADFEDRDLGLTIAAGPEGFRREPRSTLTRDDGLTWLAAHPSGGGEASWKLKSESVEAVGSRSTLVKRLKKELEVDPQRTDVSGRTADRFEWRVKRGDEERLRRKWVFQIGLSTLQLDYDAEAQWAASEQAEHSAQVFLAGVKVIDERARQFQAQSYDSRFAWDAPWRFNSAFSVATTLLFIVAVLALGWWRLSRIDF